MPTVLPYIPENITVHLGTPSSSASNVTVSFSDYIKNVASSEISRTVSEEEAPGTPGSDQTLMAKRLLGRYELPTIQRLTALCSARHPEQAGAFAALRAEAEQLTAENACCRVSQLAVNGRDLMAAGVRPGPGLRQVLNALLEAVITGQTPNEKDALLAAAAQFSAS